MLRVAALRDPTGRYYLADRGELLLGRSGSVQPGTAGRWIGNAADGLGLHGELDAEAFSRVLHGHHPGDDRPLRRRPSTVCGYDLTFAAPKSLSVLWALGTPPASQEALRAHDDAVAAAMEYVASRAVGVRRGSATDRHVEAARGIVGARFTHGTSRSLDPHLHTHVVVANVAHGLDGRWTSIDGRGLFAHARAAGALYDAHLRDVVASRLGLTWESRRSGAYELAIVDPAVIGALSSRRAEVLGHLHERSRLRTHDDVGGRLASSPRARTVAWAATRDPKTRVATWTGLRAGWTSIAADAGWSPGALAHALEGPQSARSPRPAASRAGAGVDPGVARGQDVRGDEHGRLDEHRFSALLATATNGAPARRDVVAAWAGALVRGAAVRDVTECVDTLAPWGTAVGVAEECVALRSVTVPGHIVRALGPRPASADLLRAWRRAAAEIEGYRSRWALGDSRETLGVACDAAPRVLSQMPAVRLADHIGVERTLAETRARLGVERLRDARAAERSVGWER